MDSTPATVTGAAVRAEAARVGLSLRGLARALGVSHTYITKRASGRIAFDVDDLHRVAQVLDVPVRVLLPPESDSTKAGAA